MIHRANMFYPTGVTNAIVSYMATIVYINSIHIKGVYHYEYVRQLTGNTCSGIPP